MTPWYYVEDISWKRIVSGLHLRRNLGMNDDEIEDLFDQIREEVMDLIYNKDGSFLDIMELLAEKLELDEWTEE